MPVHAGVRRTGNGRGSGLCGTALFLLLNLGRATTCHLAGWEEGTVLYYALIFLVVALIAGALGVGGVAAVASQIAWVLFVIGIILLIVHFVSGRRRLIP